MRLGATAVVGVVLAPLLCVLASCGETRGTLITTGGGGGAGGAGAWRPALAATWQIQLTGKLDTSVDAGIYDIDPFIVADTELAALHGAGRRVLCYVSVGTVEAWRDDADQFPAAAVGAVDVNYPDERWLDVRDGVVRAVMAARLDAVRRKGCDGVELSSLASGGQDTGFPLTAADLLDYARFLTAEARRLGLSPGIGGGEDRAAAYEPEFDWAFTEGCLQVAGCGAMAPFVQARKVIFAVEFGTESDLASICPRAKTAGINVLIKNRALDAFRVACP